MDYFEEQDAKAKEKLEEEKYQELYQKQAKISKIILLAVFVPMGIVFLIVGLGFILGSLEYEAGITFISCGAVFTLLGFLFYFVIPTKGNYQKYKKMVKKRGGLSLFDLSITVGLLKDRMDMLENENQTLKKKIEELERYNRQ